MPEGAEETTGPSPHDLIDLSGRVALITGGTRNIGREIAELFAGAGASVAVTGKSDREALAETLTAVRARGGDAFGELVDVAEPEQLQDVVTAAEQALGPVDILVNNAAVRPAGALEDITLEDWELVMDVNLRAPFLLSQRLLPGMRQRQRGRIVNVSGLSMLWGTPNRAHVSASKSGIAGLTVALASECATDNVTVNCIVPGVIDTERQHPEWYQDLDDFYERRTSRIPMARLGRPDEVAAVALFLASNLSSYMTGQSVFVTGGSHPMVRGA